MRFDPSVCGDLDRARKLEWLETNGLGGFASSTIVGLNTRRYHGLLTAAIKPPAARYLLLSKLEETLLIDGRHYDLACNQYAGAVYPQGHRYLKEFRLDPFPTFVYEVEQAEITKRVFMPHGENTVVVEYAARLPPGAREAWLELRPLIAFRDYHSTTHHNDAINRTVQSDAGLAGVTPYPGLPTLYFAHDANSLEASGNWYFNFEYESERERGLDSQEDLFNPLVLRFALQRQAGATVIASTQPHSAGNAAALRKREIDRRNRIAALARSTDPLVAQLTRAADQFIVRRGNLHSVIAGYHWFADWGRDTMISLPGLTLLTGRPEIARDVLEAFVASADQGMLPNRFPESGETPEYNTADAALWLFEAIRSFLQYTGDVSFVRGLYPKLREILEWHFKGTRFGIRADSDGLLLCGEPGVQLTWMDAKAGDWVVTPRIGKPVEIQALWHNALRIGADLAARLGDAEGARAFTGRAAQARESFEAQFWNAQAGCLYDVIHGDSRDASLRPNQIFAVSLHYDLMPLERQRSVVDTAERELLTPFGLRTLSPKDGRYRPRYEGGVRDRDGAYHQGTVWPWLMGPFLTAYVKVHGRSQESRKQARAWLAPFEEYARTAGLGQIPEIADGDPPHTPRGCIAQAWSVAELLRAAAENVG